MTGQPHEFVVLPEQTHENDKLHDGYFWRKIGDFFDRVLPVEPAVTPAERPLALDG